MKFDAKAHMTTSAKPDLAWFREAKFGMFIHWGIYAVAGGRWNGESIPGHSEWMVHKARIPFSDYARLADRFKPHAFDADQWVRLAQEAGMKYLVVTAKHHDGFAMFRSFHPYNVVDATPFKRDPLKEIADACHRHGMRFGLYYSQDLDWEAPGGSWKWEESGPNNEFIPVAPERFAAYLDAKVKPQLRELLTNYGPVSLIWFDVPGSITKEQSAELCDYVHALQRNCLVSGRVGHDCGDYGSTGDNQSPDGASPGDWEMPATINDNWGFKADDHNWKSPQKLIRLLAHCASTGANYLLNVGPDATGVIPAPSVERLQAIGQWMKQHGESISGTSKNPFPCDFPWGRVTCKPGHVYLHFFEWPQGPFTLAGLPNGVQGVRLLSNARVRVPFTQERDPATNAYRLSLTLPAAAPDPWLPVVALDTLSKKQE